MQLIPPYYRVLGQPPSLISCTRDCYPDGAVLDAGKALTILNGIASAADHLHGKGMAHGDIYAHNILVSAEDGHALLGELRRRNSSTVKARHGAAALRSSRSLAFAHHQRRHLGAGQRSRTRPARRGLQDLRHRCANTDPKSRPTFGEIAEELHGLVGWRGMMRLPN